MSAQLKKGMGYIIVIISSSHSNQIIWQFAGLLTFMPFTYHASNKSLALPTPILQKTDQSCPKKEEMHETKSTT